MNEAKIRIVAENATAEGFNSAADAAADSTKRIEASVEAVRSRLKAAFADVKKSFDEGMKFDPKGLNDLAAAQETVFRKLADEGKRVFESTRTPIEKLKTEQERLNKLFQSGAIDLDTYSRAMKKAETDVKAAAQSSDALSTALGKVKTMVGGVFAAVSVGAVVGMADEYTQLAARIENASNSLNEYNLIQARTQSAANITYRSLAEAQTGFLSLNTPMKALGYSTEQVLDLTDSLSFSFTANAARADQAQNAQDALSKSMQKGRIDADAWASILAAADNIAGQIGQTTGKTAEQVMQLGASGKLSIRDFVAGLSAAREENQRLAENMDASFRDGVTRIRNSLVVLFGEINKTAGITNTFASAMGWVAEHIRGVAAAVGIVSVAVISTFAPAITAATAAVWAFTAALLANPFTWLVAAIAAVTFAVVEFGDEIDIFGDSMSNLQDVVQAVWGIIGDTIADVIDTVTAIIGDLDDEITATVSGWQAFFGQAWAAIETVIKTALNLIIGHVVNAYQNLVSVWNNAPAFFSGLGSAIANVFLSAIDFMVNKAIDKLNSLISFANSAASVVGLSGIPTLNKVSVGRLDDGGFASKTAANYSRDYVGEMTGAIKTRAQAIAADREIEEAARMQSTGGSGGGAGSGGSAAGKAGGGGRKAGAGRKGSGREADPFREWQEEIAAQKLAHEQMRIETTSHQEWSIAKELAYWRSKLALVDDNSKAGLKVRSKIVDLEKQLAKQSTEAALVEVAETEKVRLHGVELQVAAADHALALGKISQAERLEAELEFEERRYQIAYEALQQRIALAEQDPTYSQQAIDKLRRDSSDLGMKHEVSQTKNKGKLDQQKDKDNPSLESMLSTGGQNVWDTAQQQMESAFTSMLTRTQSFGSAIRNMVTSIGQTFINEMIAKPLAATISRISQETGLWSMFFGKKTTMETTAAGVTVATKKSETMEVVGRNATQAASGAAASQAGIPYVGPILAVAAMGAMMAAVMALIGGGGSSSSTTTTRIPSAAQGWDIPAGVNPLTQLHESEMVLPAEQANVVRELASGGGGGGNIVINTSGGDFIHKKDLAKLLKQMNRNFTIK